MKKFGPWLGLTAASLLLAACSTGGEAGNTDSAGTTTGNNTSGDSQITAWAWDPAFNLKALDLANGYYIEDHPDFNLEVIENAQDDIVQKLNTSLSSGTTKGMPNIVLIEDYRIKSFLEAYPDAFYPITDLIEADDFADYKIEAGTVEDHIYSVPFDSGVTGLYVRKDIIEEAGLKMEDFENVTWDELIDLGIEIESKTGVKLVSSDPNDLGMLRTMIQSSGSWYTEEDGRTPYIAENEALREGFEAFKKMSDAGILNSHSDWSQYLNAFNTGIVATVAAGNWITPSVKAAEEQAGDWVVVPFPRQNIEGSVNASNLGGSSFYVLNVDGKEEAADFLASTFGSNSDLYQDLVNEIGAIGTYEPATSGEAYQQEDEFFGGQKVYADFSEWVLDIPDVNFGQNTYAVEDILIVSMQDYLNGGDLDEVLMNAQEQANNSIK